MDSELFEDHFDLGEILDYINSIHPVTILGGIASILGGIIILPLFFTFAYFKEFGDAVYNGNQPPSFRSIGAEKLLFSGAKYTAVFLGYISIPLIFIIIGLILMSTSITAIQLFGLFTLLVGSFVVSVLSAYAYPAGIGVMIKEDDLKAAFDYIRIYEIITRKDYAALWISVTIINFVAWFVLVVGLSTIVGYIAVPVIGGFLWLIYHYVLMDNFRSVL